MQTGKKRWTQVTVLAVGMALLMDFSNIGNAKATGLSEAQEEKEKLEQDLKEAQSLIKGLNSSKDDMEEAVKELDVRLQNISRQISELELQLGAKQEAIDVTQAELAEAEKDREQQYEDMKLRIQFLYENQSTTAMEKLLTAGSIAELLNNAEYISQISQYDRNMLIKYEETVEGIMQMEATLETELNELQAMKQRVEEEQLKVAGLVTEKEAKIAATEGEIVDAQKLAEAYEAEIQAQNEVIAQIQAEEKRRQEEAQGKEEEVSASGFVWPCPSSRRVTSDYGPRESPTAGASSYHKGIDIGAAGGADIVAAAGGTVIFAGYSNSAGNYVTISHGNGLYSVYMHCSSLLAAGGEKVSQGQVIAKVGSTGISTGNHLHFGVSLNGSYVNPWSYL